MQRFDRTGNVAHEKHEENLFNLSMKRTSSVFYWVLEKIRASVFEIYHLDLGRTCIQNIIKNHKLHPDHVHLLHELNHNYYEKGITSHQWVQQKINGDLLFTDLKLSTFHKNRDVNSLNFHCYATNNPNLVASTVRLCLNNLSRKSIYGIITSSLL